MLEFLENSRILEFLENVRNARMNQKSKSKRGLKTHTSRIHKDNQKPGVKHGEPEDLRDKEQEKSLNVSQRSQSRDQSFANAVLSSTLKENVNDSVNDNCTVKCDQPGCHQGFPHEEALKVHLYDKHRLPKKCPYCDLVFSCYGALGKPQHKKSTVQTVFVQIAFQPPHPQANGRFVGAIFAENLSIF